VALRLSYRDGSIKAKKIIRKRQNLFLGRGRVNENRPNIISFARIFLVILFPFDEIIDSETDL